MMNSKSLLDVLSLVLLKSPFYLVIPNIARNLLFFLTPTTLGKYAIFPGINATLNGTSAVLLFTGHGFIKRGQMAAHRAFMLAALVSSTVFLTCYLYYHYHVGSVRFQGH